MENSSSTSTGTNDYNNTQTFDLTAQQTFYPFLYNGSTTNNFGSYDQTAVQTLSSGNVSYAQQSYTGILPETATTIGSSSLSVHPIQQPSAPLPNLSNCLSFATSLPAPPPQHSEQMFPSSDQSRAGSLPLTTQHSLDQYLTAPQSHLLQLHGVNPPDQPSQTDNFHGFGMINRPQQYTSFQAVAFSADQSVKQSTVGQILEEESSSAFREASHMNRKKRKACGRCGPCQRKDNCGTCMNCVNRAKGKQICISRKCEELKKKPGTESYTSASGNSDHPIASNDVRQEKRKDLEQLFFVQSKQAKTGDTGVPLPQGIQLRQKTPVPGFTPANQNFAQQPSFPQSISASLPYSSSLPIHGSGGTFQHQILTNQSPQTINLLSNAYTIAHSTGTPGNTHTTDIISEALREIDNSNLESEHLNAVLNRAITTSGAPYQQYQQQSLQHQWKWSRTVPNFSSVPTAESESALQASLQLQGTVRLPSQPPILPPGPGPGQKLQTAGSQQFQSIAPPVTGPRALPDQLLSNLTKYNEFVSFQRNISSPIQPNISKRPPSVRRANYEDTVSDAQPLVYGSTILNSAQEVLPTSLSVSNRQPLVNQPCSMSTPTSMYHNVSSLAHSNGSATTVQASNPVMSSQLHQSYDSTPMNCNMQCAPFQTCQGVLDTGGYSNSTGNAYYSSPSYGPPNWQMLVSQSCTLAAQDPADYDLRKLSSEKCTFPDRSTSNNELPRNPPPIPNFALRQLCNNPQSPKPQWGAGAYGSQCTPTRQQHTASGVTVSIKQEISPKSSLCALHSPVSSIHKDAKVHSQVISRMPELASSPVSQYANSDMSKLSNDSPTPVLMPTRGVSIGSFVETSQRLSFVNQSDRPPYQANKIHAGASSSPSGSLHNQPGESHHQNRTNTPSLQPYYLGPPSFPGTSSRSMPPSDANSTISPGESGYDSAEIVHGAEETSSLQTSQSNTVSNNQDDRNVVSKDPNVSKNLYRAPVGTKASSDINLQALACKYSESLFKIDLPSTGAVKPSDGEFLNATSTTFDIDQTKPSGRTLSYDSAMETDKEEVNPTRMRRVSTPEVKQLPLSKKLPTSRCDGDLKISFGEESKNLKLSNGDRLLHLQMESAIPKPDVRQFTFQKNSLAGQRKIVPFDTPPLTPRSEFMHRQPGIDTASDCSVAGHKLPDILPTPPHLGEPPIGNCGVHDFVCDGGDIKSNTGNDSHRGYKAQMDNCSPRKTEFAACDCISGTDGRTDEAPYYTHLGAAGSVQGIRALFEKRTGYSGPALRIEKVIYTGKEGKTSRGCPMAKWIIRRSGEEEKVLVVCRQRPGHHCATAVIVVIILLWDGVARPLADFAYANFTNYVPKHGEPTERRCATNDDRTCACQGFDDSTCGASFSFGCSWSMYYNGCKYARSNNPNKYKLTKTKDPEAERFIGMLCEKLATVMSPLYEMAAPDAFLNQVESEEDGYECRLGEPSKMNCRPFSGVTSCMDFCAHAHKDQHNIDNGSTVVVTFTKPELRTVGGKHMDEQLHVLPLCKLDISNEQGNIDGVAKKLESGALEILRSYHHEVRLLSKPKLSKKQKSRAKKKTDSSDSPPYKRRGRPPKRCSSLENPLEGGDLKVTRTVNMDPCQQNQVLYQMPPQMQRFAPRSSGVNCHRPSPQLSLPGPLSHTRWPYRKPASKDVPLPQMQHHLIGGNEKRHVGHSTIQNKFLLDNLPSIGNFFPVAAGNANNQYTPSAPKQAQHNVTQQALRSEGQTPQVPTSSPTIATLSTPSIERGDPHSQHHLHLPIDLDNPTRTTPLPSIKNVVMHPFHQNFVSVSPHSANSNSRSAVPQTSSSSRVLPQVDTSSTMGTYAAQSNTNMILGDRSPDTPEYVLNNGTEHPQAVGHAAIHSDQTVIYSDSEENFLDPEIGGVAVAPGHGSILIECAKKELHATTALHRPNRFYPSRISLVFYQHKSMNTRNHGTAQYEAKEEERRKQREEKKLEDLQKSQESTALGMGNSQLLLPGSQSPLMQNKFTDRRFSTGALSGDTVWNSCQLGREDANFTTSNSYSTQQSSIQRMLQNGTGFLTLPNTVTQPINSYDDNTTKRFLMKQFGSNVQSPPPNFGSNVQSPPPNSPSNEVKSPMTRTPCPGRNGMSFQDAGWPQSIFHQCENLSMTHGQSSSPASIQMNGSRHVLPSVRSSSQSPIHSLNRMQSMPCVTSPRLHSNFLSTGQQRNLTQISQLPVQYAHSTPAYTQQLRQQVYMLPTFPLPPYPLPSHTQTGVYEFSGAPRVGTIPQQTSLQSPMVDITGQSAIAPRMYFAPAPPSSMTRFAAGYSSHNPSSQQ